MCVCVCVQVVSLCTFLFILPLIPLASSIIVLNLCLDPCTHKYSFVYSGISMNSLNLAYTLPCTVTVTPPFLTNSHCPFSACASAYFHPYFLVHSPCWCCSCCYSSEDTGVQYIFCHVESDFVLLVRGSPTRKNHDS